MTIYIVVRQGGEYSDAYHMNETVFVDKAEAEAYIENETTQLNVLSSFKFEHSIICPDRCAIEDAIPSGTPNGKSLRNKAWSEAYNAYYELLKIEQLKQFKEHCKKQNVIFTDKMLQMLNPFTSQAVFTTDLCIEEVEIKPTSKLYRLLNEERIPWKT